MGGWVVGEWVGGSVSVYIRCTCAEKRAVSIPGLGTWHVIRCKNLALNIRN